MLRRSRAERRHALLKNSRNRRRAASSCWSATRPAAVADDPIALPPFAPVAARHDAMSQLSGKRFRTPTDTKSTSFARWGRARGPARSPFRGLEIGAPTSNERTRQAGRSGNGRRKQWRRSCRSNRRSRATSLPQPRALADRRAARERRGARLRRPRLVGKGARPAGSAKQLSLDPRASSSSWPECSRRSRQKDPMAGMAEPYTSQPRSA